MKSKILIGLAALAVLFCVFIALQAKAADGGQCSTIQIITTNTSASATVRLANLGTMCSSATLTAIRSNRNANSGNIYIGTKTNHLAQPVTLTPGQVAVLVAPGNSYFDLHDWSLDVDNAGDGVTILYTK